MRWNWMLGLEQNRTGIWAESRIQYQDLVQKTVTETRVGCYRQDLAKLGTMKRVGLIIFIEGLACDASCWTGCQINETLWGADPGSQLLLLPSVHLSHSVTAAVLRQLGTWTHKGSIASSLVSILQESYGFPAVASAYASKLLRWLKCWVVRIWKVWIT